jgi:hypothetical protein
MTRRSRGVAQAGDVVIANADCGRKEVELLALLSKFDSPMKYLRL